MPEPLYLGYVSRLGIPESTLLAHKNQILDKLTTEDGSNLYVINNALALTNAIIHVFSSYADFKSTLSHVKTANLGHEPSEVLTSSYLYYLVNNSKIFGSEEETLKKIQKLHKLFDDINWCLSPEAVERLGIEKLERLVQPQ